MAGRRATSSPGTPVIPPYYSLRLLPYVVPQISTWKRRMLREKDLTDAMF